MEDEGEHYLAYYLMKEDQDASRFKQARLESGIDALIPEDEVRPVQISSTYCFTENEILSNRPQISTLFETTRLSRSNKTYPTSFCYCLTMVTSRSTYHPLCRTIFLYQRQTNLLIGARHGSWKRSDNGNDRESPEAKACITKVLSGRCF